MVNLKKNITSLFQKYISGKKSCILLIIIFLVASFFRLYKYDQLFMYNHDNDLSSWFVRDLVEDKHLRLIGQLTSTPGIFIGPYFYYYLIPFYLIFNMDPIGGVFAVYFISLLGLGSVFYIFSKLYGKSTGFISALVYSVNFFLVFNDREVVPTMPVIIWSIWFYYSLELLIRGRKSGYLLLGILAALIWNLNMALIITIPLVLLAIIFSRKKPDTKSFLKGFVLFIIFSVPLFLFEIRHNFIQFRSLISSLTKDQGTVIHGFFRIEKVINSMGVSLREFYFGSVFNFNILFYLITGILIFAFLIYTKALKKNIAIVFVSWVVLYLSFFSLYSKIISEYYLDGVMVVWFVCLVLFFNKILEAKGKIIFFALLLLYVGFHVYSFFDYKINRSGYLERKNIIKHIGEDSKNKGYPCISISYITDPGYDLGYRYFIHLNKIKTKKINDQVPVYSIVFPQSKTDRLDVSFGAIGLIYPDYTKYNLSDMNNFCLGENYNLIEPMFGFTN